MNQGTNAEKQIDEQFEYKLPLEYHLPTEYKMPNEESIQELGNNFLPQKAPSGGLSTSYIGTRTSKLNNSTEMVRFSTDSYKKNSYNYVSTLNYRSSTDILDYLKNHPDYLKIPPDVWDKVVAGIAAGLVVAGGVTVIILTGASGVGLNIGLGIMFIGGKGILQVATSDTVDFGSFLKSIGLEITLSLLTFGAGYSAGSYVGIALSGRLTETAIKSAAALAGALAGSIANSGAHIIVNYVNNKPIEAFEIIFDAVSGAMQGAFAGYLGAKARMVTLEDLPITKSEARLLKGNLEDVHSILDISEPSRKGVEVIGITVGDEGKGLIHVLKRHPDLIEKLGFTKSQIEQCLLDVSSPGLKNSGLDMLNKISDALCKQISHSMPYGLGVDKYFFDMGDYCMQASVSKALYNSAQGNMKILIQANILSKDKLLKSPKLIAMFKPSV